MWPTKYHALLTRYNNNLVIISVISLVMATNTKNIFNFYISRIFCDLFNIYAVVDICNPSVGFIFVDIVQICDADNVFLTK